MKQGTGKNTIHGKDPGRGHGVSVGHVSEMGNHTTYMKDHPPPKLYEGKGRGSSAPGYTCTTHHCGSQGKH